MSAAADGALVLAWHHSTRSVGAHCFEGDRPLCQDSDPGEIIDKNRPGRLLGRTCEDCRAVYKSRILHAIHRAKEARATDENAASDQPCPGCGESLHGCIQDIGYCCGKCPPRHESSPPDESAVQCHRCKGWGDYDPCLQCVNTAGNRASTPPLSVARKSAKGDSR